MGCLSLSPGSGSREETCTTGLLVVIFSCGGENEEGCPGKGLCPPRGSSETGRLEVEEGGARGKVREVGELVEARSCVWNVGEMAEGRAWGNVESVAGGERVVAVEGMGAWGRCLAWV